MISLYGPAIKTQYWQEIYENFSASGIPFEIIFAGFNPPNFTLPGNFHFIFTNSKIALAAEMARRRCTGDFIMNIPDDVVFQKNALSLYMEEYEKLTNKKTMITSWYGNQWNWVHEPDHRMNLKDPNSIILPFIGMIPMQYQKEIGGIDRRFWSEYWDIDLFFRFHHSGGQLKFTGRPDAETLVGEIRHYGREQLQIDGCSIVWERTDATGNAWKHGVEDRAFLQHLFGHDGKSPRCLPVQEYNDEELKS